MAQSHITHALNRCLDLAKIAGKSVIPNPHVGAVLMHNNQIIGEAYHAYFGGPHAEVAAIQSVDPKHIKNIPDASLFVSLEPCNHHGKTGPCTEFILKHNIKHVVVGCLDPNPLMSGKSIAYLRSNGVQVDIAQDVTPFDSLISDYRTRMLNKRPVVILKWAESSDGYIGKRGEKYQISQPEAQILNHKWRSEADAILIGSNTALEDNPQLTTRHWPGPDPYRVVIDRRHRLTGTESIFRDDGKTIYISHVHRSDISCPQILVGAELAPESFLHELVQQLGRLGIKTLLVEGGAQILKSFIDTEIWDELRIIKSPNALVSGISSPMIRAQMFQTLNIGKDKVLFGRKIWTDNS